MVTKKEIENKAFNDALSESLEKTFSGEFSSVIKSEGLVGEKFKGQHSKLLDLVGDNTQKLAKAVPLTLGHNRCSCRDGQRKGSQSNRKQVGIPALQSAPSGPLESPCQRFAL